MLLFVSAVAVLAGALTAAAQNPPAPPESSFTSRADLVLVPVHVTRHGEHVAHLAKEAFTLSQDGKPVKVAVFDEVRTSNERLLRVTVPPGEFSNELEGNPNAARYTVIAIDTINTSPMDMNRLSQGLLKFLSRTADSGEPIRLVMITPAGITMVQDFTTDPKILAAALKLVRSSEGRDNLGNKTLSTLIREMQAEAERKGDTASLIGAGALEDSEERSISFQERNRRLSSLEMLQQLALSLTGLPGRKSLVWASSGYPFGGAASKYGDLRKSSAAARYSTAQLLEAVDLDEYTTSVLNTANVAVYPVDARGLVNTAYQSIDPEGKYAPQAMDEIYPQVHNQDFVTTFAHLAAATGGRSCIERTNLETCFQEAMDDSRDYYMLGYYIDRRKLSPGWHKIAVKVAESGVSVRSRNGFALAKFTPEEVRTSDVRLELGSRLMNPGIAFRGRWTGTTTKGDKKVVGVELRIPAGADLISSGGSRLNLDIAAVARKRDGALAGQFAQHMETKLSADAAEMIRSKGLLYKHTLEVPRGVYMVRFVVRDNVSGRMGSISTVLSVD